MPQSVYRLDLKKPAEAKPELWEQVEADIDFAQYEVEQVTYPSKDKTPITMFLAHKKGLKRDGTTPTLLYGYGGFNISLTPIVRRSRFLFLEHGGLLAMPTCAAAASTARTGTRPACSARSKTCSTISSPRPSG